MHGSTDELKAPIGAISSFVDPYMFGRVEFSQLGSPLLESCLCLPIARIRDKIGGIRGFGEFGGIPDRLGWLWIPTQPPHLPPLRTQGASGAEFSEDDAGEVLKRPARPVTTTTSPVASSSRGAPFEPESPAVRAPIQMSLPPAGDSLSAAMMLFFSSP